MVRRIIENPRSWLILLGVEVLFCLVFLFVFKSIWGSLIPILIIIPTTFGYRHFDFKFFKETLIECLVFEDIHKFLILEGRLCQKKESLVQDYIEVLLEESEIRIPDLIPALYISKGRVYRRVLEILRNRLSYGYSIVEIRNVNLTLLSEREKEAFLKVFEETIKGLYHDILVEAKFEVNFKDELLEILKKEFEKRINEDLAQIYKRMCDYYEMVVKSNEEIENLNELEMLILKHMKDYFEGCKKEDILRLQVELPEGTISDLVNNHIDVNIYKNKL